LDRYGELELVAERWRGGVRELPEDAVLVVNADDPQVGDLAREHARSLAFGLDDPRHARPTLEHAADSKWCLRCGTAYAYAPAFGRFERIVVGDRTLLVLLIKNPAGSNEAIRTLLGGGAPRVALVALNDAIADGRDVSWIWDVDFEPLFDGLETLVATGERA